MKLFQVVFLVIALSAHASKIPGVEYELKKGDGRIGTYVSSWKGFRTSSYWIEGPKGLILIDSQFLLSAGEEMLDWAEKLTGKKAVLAIILHPNPDKFNGTAHFQKRGIKVVTSQQVLDRIPAVHRLRSGWFYERYKPDYPTAEPKPESFGSQTIELEAAGLKVKAHVLKRGCSDAHVVVEFDENVFVGDLVTIGFHSWLELGYLSDWLDRLKEIQALEPKYVRTGRGGSGDTDSLKREVEYLKTVQSIFTKYKKSNRKLTDSVAKKIANEIFAQYPSYEYPLFVENGIEAVWAQIR